MAKARLRFTSANWLCMGEGFRALGFRVRGFRGLGFRGLRFSFDTGVSGCMYFGFSK